MVRCRLPIQMIPIMIHPADSVKMCIRDRDDTSLFCNEIPHYSTAQQQTGGSGDPGGTARNAAAARRRCFQLLGICGLFGAEYYFHMFNPQPPQFPPHDPCQGATISLRQVCQAQELSLIHIFQWQGGSRYPRLDRDDTNYKEVPLDARKSDPEMQ